jgi:hypothetical protein
MYPKKYFEFGFEFAEKFELESCPPGQATLSARILQTSLNKPLIPL